MKTKIPRYKIVSADGLGRGSKLIDLQDGKEIAQISKVILRADADDLWRAEVTLIGVAVDVALADRSAIVEVEQ